MQWKEILSLFFILVCYGSCKLQDEIKPAGWYFVSSNIRTADTSRIRCVRKDYMCMSCVPSTDVHVSLVEPVFETHKIDLRSVPFSFFPICSPQKRRGKRRRRTSADSSENDRKRRKKVCQSVLKFCGQFRSICYTHTHARTHACMHTHTYMHTCSHTYMRTS